MNEATGLKRQACKLANKGFENKDNKAWHEQTFEMSKQPAGWPQSSLSVGDE